MEKEAIPKILHHQIALSYKPKGNDVYQIIFAKENFDTGLCIVDDKCDV